MSDVVSIRDEALQLELPFKRQCVDVQLRRGSPSSPSGLYVAVKRLLDIVAATLLILATVPVLGLAALAIAAEGGGPIIFSQVRIGKDGRRFTLYKLRTMIPDAEWRLCDLLAHNQRAGPLFKMEDDPRVTRIGRFLRAMSIDELPQLINVLRGEMSMVGPRPALPAEVDAFSDRLRERLLVLPGITGLWQIQARHSPSFAVYERLDLLYLEKSSLRLDLLIMLKTAGQILTAVFTVVARALPLVMACAHQRKPCDIAQVDHDLVATRPVPSSALRGWGVEQRSCWPAGSAGTGPGPGSVGRSGSGAWQGQAAVGAGRRAGPHRWRHPRPVRHRRGGAGRRVARAASD